MNSQNHNNLQSSESESDDDDDLMLFQQAKRMKVIKENHLSVGIYSDSALEQSHSHNDQSQSSNDDFNKFYGNQADLIRKQIHQKLPQTQTIPQINQQQLSAKRLRAFNAAKYFQKIKLSFLRQVYNEIREVNEVLGNYNQKVQAVWAQREFDVFLSLLDIGTIEKCMKIREKGVFTVDDIEVLTVFRQVFIEKVLDRYYESNQDELARDNNDQSIQKTKKLTKAQLLFKLSQFLHCKIKKLSYFSINQFVDQSFYNLNFEHHLKQKQKKTKSKTTTKLQQQIKNKIQRHVYQQQLELLQQKQEQFVDLGEFQFDTVSRNAKKTPQQINNELKATKKRSQKLLQIKRQFMNNTYMMFSFLQNRWKPFIAVEGHFQQLEIQWFKENILNGLPIIAFYSFEGLKVLPQYQKLFQLRKMSNIVVKDMSMFFCDNWKKLVGRKRRVGVKPLIGKIFRFCNFIKPTDMLEQYQAYQLQRTIKETKQFLINTQLPKTKIQFNLTQYFLTPSRVGKYHILSPQAKPIQTNLQTIQQNQQKIYWKDELIPVCSRMGWIDFQRMVKQGEQALKKTQNRNKKPIQLYSYQQTTPYVLPVDQQGNFILDPQHNSVYVPPNLIIPPETCIVRQKITYICNKHKIKFAKLVQGFVHTGGMRVLPNQIGYILYEKDKENVMKWYEERLEVLNRNKQTRYDEKIQKMWKDVIKFVKLIERMGQGGGGG